MNRRKIQSISYYDENAQEYFNKSAHLELGSLYLPFLSHLSLDKHILDAGCGCGRDSKYFLSLGYKVTSIDASEAMTRISSELTGQKTLQLDFRDLKFSNEFDGIWALASLLHIPKREIKGVMSRFVQSLRAEGVWYMSFKEGEDEKVESGRLFNNYTKNSLHELLLQYPELEILNISYTLDCIGRPQKWVNALVRKRSL